MKLPAESCLRLAAALGSQELVAALLGGRETLSRSELAEVVIKLLTYDLENWIMDSENRYVTYRGDRLRVWIGGQVQLWQSNSTFDDKPLGTIFQRRKIKRLTKQLKHPPKNTSRQPVSKLF